MGRQVALLLAVFVVVVALQQGCSQELTATNEAETATEAASVEIAPSSISLLVGGTAFLTAVTRDAGGNILTGPLVEWASSNPSIVTVDVRGQITGVAEDTASVSATTEGQTAEAAVTVVAKVGGPQTYFVDIGHSAASDDNPGTEALPWKTISKAAATLKAGETVYVKNGTYVEESCPSSGTPSAAPANSGTPGNYIAFRAYPGHKPLVTNSTIPSVSGCPVIGAKYNSYIIWDGFEVSLGGTKAVMVNDSDHIIIENSEIHGMRGPNGDNTDAIRVDNSSDVIIRNNLIYDVKNASGSTNGTGVKMYYSSRVIVENNEVYDVGAGIRNKNGGQDNIFRNNWVHDCSSYGIQLKTTTDAKAYSNIVKNCSSGVSTSTATNPQVYNNTFVNLHGSNIVRARESGSTGGLQVWNNIAYASSNRDLYDGNPRISYCDYNLYWQTEEKCGSNNVLGDPLFVDGSFQGPEDFKLQSGSPARGAGRNGEDIGAYAQGNEVIGRRR